MGERTEISWCDHTFNPWWGCTKVSPACTNCYAERDSKRWGTGWGPKAERRFFGEAHWKKPLAWARKAKKEGVRRRVFCASMADAFEDHDDPRIREARESLWGLIYATSESLDWLLLTKRPQGVRMMIPPSWLCGKWPKNAWLGVTAETQKHYDIRVPHLMKLDAPIKFLSCEPLLGKVTILDDLDWVIAGGESGPKARPSYPGWFERMVLECDALNIPFHFKQWGAFSPSYDHTADEGDYWVWPDGEWNQAYPGSRASTLTLPLLMKRLGKKRSGSKLAFKEIKQFPAVPS